MLPHIAALADSRNPAPPQAPRAASDTTVGGIIFDVPGVLYDATLWRRWLLQLMGRLGVRLSHDQFVSRWNTYLRDVHRGRREFAEALQSFLLECGLSWALVDEVEAASRIQRQNLEQNVRPLPGVVRALDALNGLGMPLAAWADAPHAADKLAERLARLLPAAHFQATLTSFDLECAQPDAQCYRAVLEALGLPAQQVVYVGHDAAHLAGAAAAGLRTVAFNFQPNAHADHYLTRFEDLLAVVKV